MERLVRMAAALHHAGSAGVTAEKLWEIAGFADRADPGSQTARDLRHLRDAGWQIDQIDDPDGFVHREPEGETFDFDALDRMLGEAAGGAEPGKGQHVDMDKGKDEAADKDKGSDEDKGDSDR